MHPLSRLSGFHPKLHNNCPLTGDQCSACACPLCCATARGVWGFPPPHSDAAGLHTLVPGLEWESHPGSETVFTLELGPRVGGQTNAPDGRGSIGDRGREQGGPGEGKTRTEGEGSVSGKFSVATHVLAEDS